jgi:hypothetical protein
MQLNQRDDPTLALAHRSHHHTKEGRRVHFDMKAMLVANVKRSGNNGHNRALDSQHRPYAWRPRIEPDPR